ncbi:MAG: molybdopterin-dependent oxidoreductase [Acidobacteriota bacterium]|nr:molybdopterin-dependent oxidoreductase [Acidobacteriota bacterium]
MSEMNRRDVMKTGLAVAALGAASSFDWVLPALAQGETVVPFTDFPPTFNPAPSVDRRLFDTRTLSGAYTPKDQFFTTQHYGHPEIDAAAYRLKVGGEVNAPKSLSLDEIRKMGSTELIAGFECSGNRRPVQGLIGNGRWTGVPLKTVLDAAGLKADAHEIVFFGADRGKETVAFRGTNFEVEQQYGRSLPRARALASDPAPFLAYALNGEPLTKHQGAPLRLIVPGWYGAPNVKWLSEIVAQSDPYMGKFQTHWYRTLKGEMINGEMKWVETGITHHNLKSFVARVTKTGNAHKLTTIVLNDGTPIKSVEVKIDDGPWHAATADPSTTAKYGWKLYNYTWNGASAGEHTVISRVTDATGKVQPTEADLANKKTFLEDNSQHPRKVMVT